MADIRQRTYGREYETSPVAGSSAGMRPGASAGPHQGIQSRRVAGVSAIRGGKNGGGSLGHRDGNSVEGGAFRADQFFIAPLCRGGGEEGRMRAVKN